MINKWYSFIHEPGITPLRTCGELMKKRGYSWIVVVALLVGACHTFFTPQVADAYSLNFGLDGSGYPTGGAVTIPYDANLDVDTGAFNL